MKLFSKLRRKAGRTTSDDGAGGSTATSPKAFPSGIKELCKGEDSIVE